MRTETIKPPTAAGQGNSASAAASAGAIGSYRWTICALLFFATTINYLDRQVLSLLAPLLTKEFGWTEHRLRQHHRHLPVRRTRSRCCSPAA